MGVREETEAKILDAVASLVAARVQERLSPGRRGLRARDPIRERVPSEVAGALEAIVAKVAREVEAEVEFVAAVAPQAVDGRFRVLTNEAPCSTCGVVSRVATLEIRGGAVVGVACEACGG